MISFPPATEMFQFPGLPPPGLFDSARGDRALPQPGFPIRTSPDRRLLATPRSFTQPATSFIGSWRQGIPPVPFVACPLPAPDLAVSRGWDRFGIESLNNSAKSKIDLLPNNSSSFQGAARRLAGDDRASRSGPPAV